MNYGLASKNNSKTHTRQTSFCSLFGSQSKVKQAEGERETLSLEFPREQVLQTLSYCAGLMLCKYNFGFPKSLHLHF